MMTSYKVYYNVIKLVKQVNKFTLILLIRMRIKQTSELEAIINLYRKAKNMQFIYFCFSFIYEQCFFRYRCIAVFKMLKNIKCLFYR